MASNRHLGRIVALQSLYEFDFRTDCGDLEVDLVEVTTRNTERYSETIDDKEFIQSLVNGVVNNVDKLNKVLQPIAPDWPINQIARVDRTILWIGLYELQFSPQVPPKVVINEAVELAKAFGGDNSSRFINGVLGTAYRNIEAKAAKPATSKPATTDDETQSEDDSSSAKDQEPNNDQPTEQN